MGESFQEPRPRLSEEELRAADAVEVAKWRHQDGQLLTTDEQAQAADRLAELRQELRQQYGLDNEITQQSQGEQ